MRVLFIISCLFAVTSLSSISGQSIDMDNNNPSTSLHLTKNSHFSFPTVKHHPNLKAFLKTGKSKNNQVNTKKLTKFQKFIENVTLKKQQFKNESQFLNYLFFKTHQKFLKTYAAHATVTDIFTKGAYDCVSGTALYAIILDQLHINYTIKEFDYHVLLLINQGNKTYLMESTDPLHGFVDHSELITARINAYVHESDTNAKLEKLGSDNSKFQSPNAINNNINLQQLLGLQYYNNAIYFYNKEMPKETINALKKSLHYYNSKRIREFTIHTYKLFANESVLAQLRHN